MKITWGICASSTGAGDVLQQPCTVTSCPDRLVQTLLFFGNGMVAMFRLRSVEGEVGVMQVYCVNKVFGPELGVYWFHDRGYIPSLI